MVGNLANFTKLDIVRCLLNIEKPVSRAKLSETLELGEGTVRTVLDILKKNMLLASDKKGHCLSEKGNNIVKKIRNSINIKKIVLDSLYKDKKKIAIQIKNPKKIGKSYALRDIAVKNGADGAIILKYDGKLRIDDYASKDDFSDIEKKFNLAKKDIVILVFADSYRLAEHAAIGVAAELCHDLKQLMEKLK